MKKIAICTLSMLMLNGCALYECSTYHDIPDEDDTKTTLSFCMWKNDYDTLINEGQKRKHIFNVLKSDDPRGKNAHYFREDALWAFMIYPSGVVSPNSRYSNYNIDEWKQLEDKRIKYNKQRVEDEKVQKEQHEKSRMEQEKRDKILMEKSGGKGWCSSPFGSSLLNLPKDCMFEMWGGFFWVLQQIDDGTLIQSPINTTPQTYLIESNKTDAELVDGAGIPAGVFMKTGTYKYVNTLGATKTIYKIKRIEKY